MPSYSQVLNIVTSTLKHDPSAVFHLESEPGTGKTSLALEVAKVMGVPPERVLIFRPSLHDPTDLMGVPSVVDGVTQFNPPREFWQFRKGTGPGLIVWDETAQGIMMMVNAIGGAMLDKFIGPLHFDPQVMQISTGNKAVHKAGSKELPSQVRNRLNILELETSLDDWSAWAIGIGIHPYAIAFMRLRPDLLSNFDPSQERNATPRSWERVFTTIPTSLPTAEYLYACQGYVGEGPASEWVAARDLMSKMPNIDVVRLHPKTTEVPEEPAVKYAVSTALAVTTDEGNFARTMDYVSRMDREFQMVYITDALRKNSELQTTKEFISWALANKDIFINND